MPNPTWNWYLARSTDFSILAELDRITGRSITPQLNSREAANFSISVLDPAAPLVQKVTTCVLCYRNQKPVWSGPIWTKQPAGASGQMQVGCVGWFEHLNNRLLKCGNNPDVGPSKTTTATSMQYKGVDQCQIASDLVSRAIFDEQSQGAPSYYTLGNVPANTQTRNLVVQRFQNIGQQITTLSQIESGFDFHVDPTISSRPLNFHYDPIWPPGGPFTVNGRGKIRPNAVFGFKTGPNNLADVRPQEDASKITNEEYAVGQYAVGEGTWPDSIQHIGLFTKQTSISDLVTTEVLTAFAQGEALVNAYGLDVYSFDQLPSSTPSALDPFDDFDIGDFCYLMANYGSIVIPDPNKHPGVRMLPVRIFAFTVNISDEGNESVTNFQTSFQQTA